jgi:hypothetical protein
VSTPQSVEVYEGGPREGPINGQRWIRLLVRRQPRDEDREAEKLLRTFAKALSDSEFGDEFVLSIFRIESDEEASFGRLPKIENKLGCEGIEQVRRYLSMYAEDVKIPLVT